MNKIWIGFGMVVVIILAACIFVFGSGRKDEKTAAPPAANVVQISAPAIRPVPPRPLPTETQVASCVGTTLKANNLNEHTARYIQVGQRIVLPNGTRSAVARDNVWKMCRVALTDPISARYYAARTALDQQAQQLAENERDVAAAQAVVTEKARLRDRTRLEIAATQRQIASIQNELNQRHAEEVAAWQRTHRAAARPRPQHPARAAAPATS